MTKVVRRGTEKAIPELAHSIHVEVGGLRPDRWYWYQFRAGDVVTPRGARGHCPRPARPPAICALRLRRARTRAGSLHRSRHMADEDLDLAFHLGDYIYENAGRNGTVRRHAGPS